MFSLVGKIALVTGAGRGLGLAIAKGLARAGAKVLINGRSPENVQAAVSELLEDGGQAAALPFDIADEQQAVAAFATILGVYPMLLCGGGTLLGPMLPSPSLVGGTLDALFLSITGGCSVVVEPMKPDISIASSSSS